MIRDAKLFHLALLICLKFRGGNLVGRWSSVPRSGYWRTGTGSAQSTWGGEPLTCSTASTYTAVASFAICYIVSWLGGKGHEERLKPFRIVDERIEPQVIR